MLAACSCSSSPSARPALARLARTHQHRLAHSHPHPNPHPHDPRWPGWRPTVGLELHVQLTGNPKLLSTETATYDASPNTHVAPFDASLPGALPVLHPPAARLALLACLAFDARVNPRSTFDRKHYFYPDLTQGFQVTQRYNPLAKDGVVRVPRPPIPRARSKGKGKQALAEDDDEYFEVRLEQIQLEQDTAKSSHDPHLDPAGGTLVDLNRAGAALVEIVTRPDMRSPEEAAAFVKALQSALRHVGASAANMDKGELRCDVNVSVARLGPDGRETGERGTRCEVKNLNGVRFIAAAIESEIHRQIALLSSSQPVPQSTRGFNALTSSTFHLRSKESSPDYRYMPDPELGALVVDERTLDALRRDMPELPDDARRRLCREYGLGKREAGVLVALGEAREEATGTADGGEGGGGGGEGEAAEPGLGVRWFEDLARGRDAKTAANWLLHTYLGLLSRASLSLARSPLSPADLGALVDAVAAKHLTGTEAKTLLGEFVARPAARRNVEAFRAQLAERLAAAPAPSSAESGAGGGAEAAAEAALAALVDDLVASHPDEVAKIRAGNAKVVQRLVGEAMKRSRGKADAKRVGDEIRRRLLGGEGK